MNAAIFALILLNVLAVILSSIDSIRTRWFGHFFGFEVFSVVIFSAEYVLRVWACTADTRYRGTVLGRLRYMRTPLAVIDLLAVLPFFLTFTTLDLRPLRLLRAMRVVRMAKLVRYVSALRVLGRVLKSQKEELGVVVVLLALLVVISSCLVFYAEHDTQPEAFPDIPSTMYWSVITITTVGYGDIYPVTVMGKIFGAFVALLGIGAVALPTGILVAGFFEELEERKAHQKRGLICPHCGKEIE